jgi:2,5-diketo-D-gluconate reductase B
MSSIYFRKTYQRTFGTYPLKGDAVRRAVRAALEIGYRSFDTAQSYDNEADVGEALAQSGIARDELCITTKVKPDNFAPERFLASVERSLENVRVDFVDVLLLHWPPLDGNILPSFSLLEQARDRGLARHIGVSNYTAAMMRKAAAAAHGPIACNQVEFHPLIDQRVLLAAASETGIPLSSHCSVARGAVFDVPLLQELARAYDVTVAQVTLRWILQKGVSVNAMSTRPDHIRNNFEVMHFTLSSVDMARIDALNAVNRRLITRQLAPFAPVWD